MVLFNYSTRELTAKIVYYGPGLCGKTTNLQYIHENLPSEVRGKMLSLATKTDRTLFFDFLPIDLGDIRGMKTRVQLYTVPGQVFYNETRKLVLKGADGIVFVADSQETMLGANVESFKNLEENLKGHGLRLADMPHVIQFNKRDLPRLSSIDDLNAALNRYNAPFYESVATTGIGVQDTLKAIVKLVLLHLTRKYDPKALPADDKATAVRPAPPAREPSHVVQAPPRTAPPPVAARPVAAPVPPIPIAPTVVTAAPAAVSAAVSPGPVARVDATTTFDDSEIDGLVDEVDREFGPDAQARDTSWEPSVAGTADEGVWIGAPDDEASAWEGGASSPGGDAPRLDAVPAPTARPDAGFELDRGFDPEWQPEGVSDVPSPERPLVDAAPPSAASSNDLVLEEVADHNDLFADPDLEIARLEPGTARDIVVPVQLGDGATARRFRLTVRLRFDPAD